MEQNKSKHSSIGASSCARWWECPGSVALSKKAPPQEKSRAAAEGTAAHMLSELVLNRIKKGEKLIKYNDYIGTTLMVEDHEIEVDEEMVEAVELYVNTIVTETKRFGTNLSFLSIEEQFTLECDKEAYGTNDACLYKPFDTLYIWDLKYGRGIVVEAENNKQLLYYALGAIQGKDVANIKTTIVQPRAYHPDGPIRSETYSIQELKNFEKEIKKRIDYTRVPNAPLHAGDHCKFCRAITICPAIRGEANEVAKTDFNNVASLPDEILIKLAGMQERIVDFLKEVKGNLQKKAEGGMEVSGFKLVKAKSNRSWVSETLVEKAFKRQLGDELYTPRKLKSPAQMEKVAKGILKPDALLGYIEKKDAGLTLVKDSDPRHAVKSSAADDFKEIE